MSERKKPRRLISVLAEIEFEGQSTKKEEVLYCHHCRSMVLKEAGVLEHHEGPCGLPCLAGGVEVGLPFHSDTCDHPYCAAKKKEGR